jgi:prevent-host-death family protein
MSMGIKSDAAGIIRIHSDQARRHFRGLLDAVEHKDDHVWIMRYNKRAAVMVPRDWYDQAVGLMAADTITKKIEEYSHKEEL